MSERLSPYQKAIVPSHLIQSTVGNLLPYDPVYVSPSSADADYIPDVFIHNHTLHVSTETIIRRHNIQSVTGKVGLMLVAFEEVTGAIRSALIADLRFIPNFSLIPLEPGQMSDDPDTYAEMQKTIEESLAIEAFVAPEPARKISKNAEELVTRYFGPFDFYPSLEVLEQYGDKLAEQEAQSQKKQSAKQHKKNLLPRNK